MEVHHIQLLQMFKHYNLLLHHHIMKVLNNFEDIIAFPNLEIISFIRVIEKEK